MSNVTVLRDALSILAAHDVAVELVPGWETRDGSKSRDLNPEAVVVHHTGDVSTPLSMIRDGRSNLPGPLANFLVGQSGRIYLVAAGYSNNAGYGGYDNFQKAKTGTATTEMKPPSLDGTWSANSHAWSIEADGTGDWPPIVRQHVIEVCAALHIAEGWTGARVIAHKELTRRKPGDPGDDMGGVRAAVLAKIAEWTATTEPEPEPEPEPAGVVLRVATFNCLNPFVRSGDPAKLHPLTPKRIRRLVRAVVKARADVYCLTEAPEVTRNALRAGMPGGADRWKVWANGNDAIMFDSVCLQHTIYRYLDWGQWGAVLAPFTDKTTGQKIAVGSYHLPPDSIVSKDVQQQRVTELSAAMRKLDGVRFIGGDGMNDPAWADGWTDARAAATTSSNRDKPTYNGRGITDRVMSDSLTPVQWDRYRVVSTKGSDHNLVVAQVTIPTASTL